jgi:hypothetical protein
MRFFKIIGVILLAIAGLNLLQIAIEFAIRKNVYSCYEVTKNDPIEVQKKCGRMR